MNKALRERAVALRREKSMSYSEIRKRLGVSKSTLSYWLKDMPLSEQRIRDLRHAGWERGEVARERYRNTMRRKKDASEQVIYLQKKEEVNNLSREALFSAGLMLYAAEGAKTRMNRLALANTDPRIIRFFIWWLNEFFGVSRDMVRVELHLYESMEVEKEMKFWQDTLRLARAQFYKPQVRLMRKGSFTYKDSQRHGTCGLYLSSAVKSTEVLLTVRAFLDVFGGKFAGA